MTFLPRERQVFGLLVLGLLNKQIAGELLTTERMTKFHRAHMMQKMHAESIADLVRRAQKLGLTGQHLGRGKENQETGPQHS